MFPCFELSIPPTHKHPMPSASSIGASSMNWLNWSSYELGFPQRAESIHWLFLWGSSNSHYWASGGPVWGESAQSDWWGGWGKVADLWGSLSKRTNSWDRRGGDASHGLNIFLIKSVFVVQTKVIWNNLLMRTETQQDVNKLPLLSNLPVKCVKSSDFSITVCLICTQASPGWLKCTILSLIVQENCVLCCCNGNN